MDIEELGKNVVAKFGKIWSEHSKTVRNKGVVRKELKGLGVSYVENYIFSSFIVDFAILRNEKIFFIDLNEYSLYSRSGIRREIRNIQLKGVCKESNTDLLFLSSDLTEDEMRTKIREFLS